MKTRLFAVARLVAVAVAAAFLTSLSIARADQLRREGVIVSYTGVSKVCAEAIAGTVSAARAAAIDKFGFDMPETITVTVATDPSGRVRLFNDGQDRFSLTIRTPNDLRRPEAGGIRNLYGLCHEVGHLAMYRPIKQRRWMTSAMAEGWAHYIGSRLTDEVYAREGADLWSDPYDYREDGMQRLRKQLAAKPDDLGNGARLWMEFAQIVGDRGIAPVFRRWGEIAIDPADPAGPLATALADVSSSGPVQKWWQRAEQYLVAVRPKSQFVAEEARPGQAAGESKELAHDSGKAGGKRSIAGGGHAVRFEAAAGASYLTGIRLHGGRYGRPAAPKEEFHVWLCDAEFKQIADFPFPYAQFHHGRPKWVSLKSKPTRVPEEFYVCVGFNPTATNGVFLSHDDQAAEQSVVGLPGAEPASFSEGNWMIRAEVVQEPSTRTWTDTSGSFSVEAELVDILDGKVRLKKKDGRDITVPLAKLSEADQQFVKSRSGKATSSPATDAAAPKLSGTKQELKSDDGKPANKKSLPMGFAVAFEAPSDSCYLTMIRIHGARYGQRRPPAEDFHVWLCDKEFKKIADFPFPYARFRHGRFGWVTLKTKPTKVPAEFVICVGFGATATKGVFVSHDAEGRSLVGLAGKPAGHFTGGNWLIRATVDQVKAP